jgi:hypothetical protein
MICLRFHADDCNLREVHKQEAVVRRGTQEGRDEVHDNVLCSRTAPISGVSLLSAVNLIVVKQGLWQCRPGGGVFLLFYVWKMCIPVTCSVIVGMMFLSI